MNYKRFPRRPPRIQVFADLTPFFFVTFNTYARQPILANSQIHDAFKLFCHRAHAEHQIAVGRYVIMPDHVHLFVRLSPCGKTLKKWVEALRTVVGKQLLRSGVQKPHWQEGFFDHLLRSGESYSQKWEYVRMNPVRAGLCERPEDWPFQEEIVPLRFD